MPLEQKLHLRLSQKLVMTPTLQQAIKLLQMSRLELSEVMNREMVENPTLEDGDETEELDAPETTDPANEAASGSIETKTPESAPTAEESWSEFDVDAFFQDDYSDPGWRRDNIEEREDVSFEATLTRPPDLAGHLEWQLGMSHASEECKSCATFVIGNIDDDGYLTLSKDEIVALGPYSAELVEEALTLVRGFDPSGVGASDLRDCLLLQLDHLGVNDTLARTIVREHWDAFLNRRFAELAQSLGVALSELEAVVEVVRHLEPKPGRAYSTERTIYVEPDVSVTKVSGDYVISLNDDGMPRLRISERYRRMLRGEAGRTEPETASYIREKIRSAVWLIKSLDQRQRTIYKVAESIVRHQREFLDRGIDALRPMVLRDVAQDIGMHESTVSRVVSNKYMHTPRGLFPMKYFFHSGIDTRGGADVSSLSVKQKIKALIDGEDTHRPLADAKLMQILNREGINIARRTVAKYREELRIPSSNDRRKVF